MLIFAELLVIAMKLQSTENLCMITMLLFLHYTSRPQKNANVLEMYYHASCKEPILSGASVVSATQV
jgi:hypothetical protein